MPIILQNQISDHRSKISPYDIRKNVACDILAPSAVAEGNIFLSRECASIAERFL